MARLLYAALVFSFCAAMDWLAFAKGVFNGYEATALATLAGGLSAAWVTGKIKRSPPAQLSTPPAAPEQGSDPNPPA